MKNIIIPAIFPTSKRILLFRFSFEKIIADEKRIIKRRLSGLAVIDKTIKIKNILILSLDSEKSAMKTNMADIALGLASDAAFNKNGLTDISIDKMNTGMIFL
jgi:hypothetical protein